MQVLEGGVKSSLLIIIVLAVGLYYFTAEENTENDPSKWSEMKIEFAAEPENSQAEKTRPVKNHKTEREAQNKSKIPSIAKVEAASVSDEYLDKSKEDVVNPKSEKFDKMKKIKGKIQDSEVYDHRGLVKKEHNAGEKFSDGTVVGQKQAVVFIERFEKELFEQLESVDLESIHKDFGDDLAWFQIVGNSRKIQKCEAINKMQKHFGLPMTPLKNCIENIFENARLTQ
jgi:hypothetical protein